MVENSYRVVPRGKSGFDVEMDKPNGRKTTVPGFRSEHEANAWIVQAQRLIRDAGPWTPLAPRKPVARPANGMAEVAAAPPLDDKPLPAKREATPGQSASVKTAPVQTAAVRSSVGRTAPARAAPARTARKR
jgi:hypothetical protein